jgi:hypothetical protein
MEALDIFGKKIDGGKDGRLVDCCSSEEFNSALTSATKNWNTIHENGKDFVNYFLKEKADVIRETATADIRSVATKLTTERTSLSYLICISILSVNCLYTGCIKKKFTDEKHSLNQRALKISKNFRLAWVV